MKIHLFTTTSSTHSKALRISLEILDNFICIFYTNETAASTTELQFLMQHLKLFTFSGPVQELMAQ